LSCLPATHSDCPGVPERDYSQSDKDLAAAISPRLDRPHFGGARIDRIHRQVAFLPDRQIPDVAHGRLPFGPA
jgi:hypothetical protein